MQPELSRREISRETCYVPATHEGKGRRTAVAPGQTPMRNLHYGRITLDAGDEALAFETGTHETALVCLNGEAEISVGGEAYRLGRYDALYVPSPLSATHTLETTVVCASATACRHTNDRRMKQVRID